MESSLKRRLSACLRRELERLLDARVIANWRYERHQLAERLARIFDVFAVDCVLDVGANVGRYRDFLRAEVGYDGLILSIEPQPSCYEVLQREARKDPHWRVERVAVGEEVGELKLNVMQNTQFSSFLAPNRTTGLFPNDNRVVAELITPVAVLSDRIDELKLHHGVSRFFLKLDTQGYDLLAWQGARSRREDIVALQSEVAVKTLYEGMPDIVDSLATFRGDGYEVSGIYPVENGRFPYAIEFDCVMVQGWGGDAAQCA